MGLNYGASFQTIDVINATHEGVFASYALAEHLATLFPNDGLHPSILDAALQSVIGLRCYGEGEQELALPFSLESWETFGPLSTQGTIVGVHHPELLKS